MHANAQTAVGQRFERKGVVKIFGVVGVDGEDWTLAVIEPALELLGLDGVGERGDLALDLGREGGVEVVFPIHAEEFGAGFKGLAEDIGEHAS